MSNLQKDKLSTILLSKTQVKDRSCRILLTGEHVPHSWLEITRNKEENNKKAKRCVTSNMGEDIMYKFNLYQGINGNVFVVLCLTMLYVWILPM